MSEDIGVQFVDSLEQQFGDHPGERAIHAKGVGAQGTFTPSGAAAAVTSAAHLTADGPLPVVARFSNGDGDPSASDGAAFSRGFAVRFALEDGRSTDLLSIVAEAFITPEPEVFLAFIRALRPDADSGKPSGLKLAEFGARHPIVMARVIAQQRKPVPESFATTAWHAVHVFTMRNAEGLTCAVRQRWRPVAQPSTLERSEAEKRGADYLVDDARARLDAGGMAFDLELQVGEPGDASDRPDEAWPDSRRLIVAGRLSLTAPFDAEPLCFSPGNVIDGIAEPDDDIYRARLRAYSVSQDRRKG